MYTYWDGLASRPFDKPDMFACIRWVAICKLRRRVSELRRLLATITISAWKMREMARFRVLRPTMLPTRFLSSVETRVLLYHLLFIALSRLMFEKEDVYVASDAPVDCVFFSPY